MSCFLFLITVSKYFISLNKARCFSSITKYSYPGLVVCPKFLSYSDEFFAFVNKNIVCNCFAMAEHCKDFTPDEYIFIQNIFDIWNLQLFNSLTGFTLAYKVSRVRQWNLRSQLLGSQNQGFSSCIFWNFDY